MWVLHRVLEQYAFSRSPELLAGPYHPHLVTAASRFTLRTLPLAKLKNYANAYNIKTTGAVEKDDVVDAIMRARVSNHRFYYLSLFVVLNHCIDPNRRPFSRERGA